MASGRAPFTRDDDILLTKYIAVYQPKVEGRSGNELYKRLVENAQNKWKWSENHSWQSWRDRYVKNKDYFNHKIRQYQSKHNIAPESKSPSTRRHPAQTSEREGLKRKRESDHAPHLPVAKRQETSTPRPVASSSRVTLEDMPVAPKNRAPGMQSNGDAFEPPVASLRSDNYSGGIFEESDNASDEDEIESQLILRQHSARPKPDDPPRTPTEPSENVYPSLKALPAPNLSPSTTVPEPVIPRKSTMSSQSGRLNESNAPPMETSNASNAPRAAQRPERKHPLPRKEKDVFGSDSDLESVKGTFESPNGVTSSKRKGKTLPPALTQGPFGNHFASRNVNDDSDDDDEKPTHRWPPLRQHNQQAVSSTSKPAADQTSVVNTKNGVVNADVVVTKRHVGDNMGGSPADKRMPQIEKSGPGDTDTSGVAQNSKSDQSLEPLRQRIEAKPPKSTDLLAPASDMSNLSAVGAGRLASSKQSVSNSLVDLRSVYRKQVRRRQRDPLVPKRSRPSIQSESTTARSESVDSVPARYHPTPPTSRDAARAISRDVSYATSPSDVAADPDDKKRYTAKDHARRGNVSISVLDQDLVNEWERSYIHHLAEEHEYGEEAVWQMYRHLGSLSETRSMLTLMRSGDLRARRSEGANSKVRGDQKSWDRAQNMDRPVDADQSVFDPPAASTPQATSVPRTETRRPTNGIDLSRSSLTYMRRSSRLHPIDVSHDDASHSATKLEDAPIRLRQSLDPGAFLLGTHAELSRTVHTPPRKMRASFPGAVPGLEFRYVPLREHAPEYSPPSQSRAERLLMAESLANKDVSPPRYARGAKERGQVDYTGEHGLDARRRDVRQAQGEEVMHHGRAATQDKHDDRGTRSRHSTPTPVPGVQLDLPTRKPRTESHRSSPPGTEAALSVNEQADNGALNVAPESDHDVEHEAHIVSDIIPVSSDGICNQNDDPDISMGDGSSNAARHTKEDISDAAASALDTNAVHDINVPLHSDLVGSGFVVDEIENPDVLMADKSLDIGHQDDNDLMFDVAVSAPNAIGRRTMCSTADESNIADISVGDGSLDMPDEFTDVVASSSHVGARSLKWTKEEDALFRGACSEKRTALLELETRTDSVFLLQHMIALMQDLGSSVVRK